jgi:hypothetical protein
MSAATKFRGHLILAYMAGRFAAQRDDWMRLARQEKSKGEERFLISQSVAYARKRNKELVRTLREVAP